MIASRVDRATSPPSGGRRRRGCRGRRPPRVRVAAPQLHAERSREGGLHDSGVGAGVGAGVSAYDGRGRRGSRRPTEPRARPGRRTPGRAPSWPRRRGGRTPSRTARTGVTVADHRVQGVHGAIAEQSRQPATAPQRSGATTASELFSATDSTPARATSEASSVAVSRPTSRATWRRAAGRSPCRGGRPPPPPRGPATGRRARSRWRPRSAPRWQRIPAAAAFEQPHRRPPAPRPPPREHRAPSAVVGVQALLQPSGGPAEPGHRVPPRRVPRAIGRGRSRRSGRRRGRVGGRRGEGGHRETP